MTIQEHTQLDTPAPAGRGAGSTAWKLLYWPTGWVRAVVLATPLLYLLARPGGALDMALPQAEFLAAHTLLEVAAAVMCLSMGLTARYALAEPKRQLSRALGTAFVLVAILDLVHLASYAGMPDFITPNTSHKAIVLWLLGRVLAALALIVWCVPAPPGVVSTGVARWLIHAATAGAALLGVVAVWQPQWFPGTFEPGVGLTPLKQAAEGGVMVLMGIALAGQWSRMVRSGTEHRGVQRPVRDALILMLLGEFFFVLYGTQVTSSVNLLGHVYKMLAYACLYRSMFVHRVERPFVRLEQAREEVERRSAEYRGLLELAPMGVVVVGESGQIQLANRALEDMFGYTRSELAGQPVDVLLPDAVRGRHARQRADWAHAELPAERLRGEVRGQRKDGTLVDVEVSIAKARVGNELRMTACVSDVSHRRAYQAEIEYRATHDPLTGLPNRWRFVDELQRVIGEELPAAAHVGMAIVDPAGFKQLNERHGNAVADELLKELSRVLVSALPENAFVARLGGDVFGVIVPGAGAGAPLRALGERIAAALASGVHAGAIEWRVSACLGLAAFPDDATDADHLFRCADLALQEAKRQGRGQMGLFDTALGQRAQRELRVHARLQAALREETLSLHYQPQVDVASGEVCGFEALLRWTDVEIGAVPPGVFIPVAESTGLIAALGEAVLRMACRQLRRWQDEGLDTHVAINLSPREFRHPGLVARIAQELARHGVPASRLAVEVTESAVIEDFAAVREQLQALVDLGVQVHLDDFGTGHSSLAWLKAFPIATIKIDRSFVADMADDANDEAIVRAVIGLGHTLGCSIVAEGVEHQAQLQRLRALGCEAYQGWLFSPALPADQAAALLRAKRPAEAAQAL
jgi:diguanylate cyclase (GGDEF)-like protein/PAS domain S-box-containing protein